MRKITLFTSFLVLVFSFTYGQKGIKELEKGVSLQEPKEMTDLYGSKIPEDFKQKAALSEDFENDFPPFGWWIDMDGDPWDQSDQTSDHTTGDGLFARYNCYNISSGESSGLVLPVLGPTSEDNTLSFWVKYYKVSDGDGQSAELYVDFSEDYGETWTKGTNNIIDGEHGEGWFEHTVDLSSYNDANVTIRLRAISDYGYYNIAVDDVSGPEKYVADNDAGISSIEEPEGILVTGNYDVNAVLTNYGLNDLTSVNINTSIRDTVGNSEVATYSDSWTGTLATAESTGITPATHAFSNFGVYNVISSTESPNGSNDPIFTNDNASKLVPVIAPGMVYDDFESGEYASDWTAEDDWGIFSGNLMNGAYFAGIDQQDGDPARKLITPQLSVQSGDEFIFLLGGQLNEAGASNNLGYSTLTIKYASSIDGDWTELQTFDMAEEGDNPHYVSVDLSSVDVGDYYFAFETVSDFSYSQNPSLGTYVFIDDLMGPVKTSTKANDLEIVDVIYQRNFIYEGDNAEIQAVVKNVGQNEQTGNTVTFKEGGSEIGTANIGTIKYLQKDTVSVTWPATSAGKHSFTASLATDDNDANNDGSIEGIVVKPGQLAEGFEDSASIHKEWTYDEGWYQSGSAGSTFGAYEGDSLFTCDGNVEQGPYEDVKLISPRLQRDQYFDKIYFYAKAVNSSDTTETTIQLKYTQDTSSGNWKSLTFPIDLKEKWQLYEAELSSIPAGEFYIAFSASSNWEYENYVSYVLIDHVVGASYPRPGKQGTLPYDGDDQVALDSNASFRFEEEVTVNDLSGVTISGETEGNVSNVSASLQSDNRTVEITHDTYANNNETYTVTIPYNSVKNDKNAGNLEQSWSFTTIMATPEAEYYYPDTSAQGIALDEEVLVRIDQEVSELDLSGVAITGATEGNVGGVSATIANDSKTIEIEHDDFANMSEEYTITIPADAFSNADNVTNEEISWSFTTRSSGQPVADTLLPNNNGTSVALDSVVYLVFDMAVSKGDFTGIDIYDSDSISVSNVSATLLNSNSGDNDTLVINHDDFSKSGEYYTINVPAGAVNASGVDNANIKWQFTTLLAPPHVVSVSPENQETDVSISSSVIVQFDKNISEYDFSGIQIDGENSGTVGGINVSMAGNDQIIIDHDDFEKGEAYTVTIPADVVSNVDGITNEAVNPWSFTTEFPRPEAVELNPSDGAIEQPISGELFAKFNTYIDSVNFSPMTVTDSLGNSFSIDPYLNEEDTTIVIPYESFDYGMEYTADVPSGVVENKDGLSNDAFSWSFTTLAKHLVTFKVTYNGDAKENIEIVVAEDTLVTNSDGQAVKEFLNGTYDYTIDEFSYETVSGSFTIDGSDITETIELDGAFDLTFNVTDEENNPLEEAVIYINTDEDTLYTNSSGVAVLMNITDKNYNYKADKDGYFSVSDNIRVESDTTLTIQLPASSTGAVGLEEAGANLYPNPTDGKFFVTLDSPEDSWLKVYSMSGSLVLEKNLNETRTLVDIKNADAGIYLVEIGKGSRTYQTRIIKK